MFNHFFTKKVEHTFSVDGMHCASCVKHITNALNNVKGVVGVNVDLENKKVIVETKEDVPAETLSAAITEAGYQVVN